MGKDYYKILGVEKNATQEEIKKAFRKKAHQFHPDKETGDEAKFKEANEAYQVLGKEDKRKQYDQYGSTFDQQGGFGGGMNWEDFMQYARQGGAGFQGGGGGFNVDLGDIFGDMFGFGGGRGGRRSGGRDLQTEINVDFKEAAFGVKKKIELNRNSKCSKCHGNGAEPGTPIKDCAPCQGSGRVTRVQQTFLGAMQTQSPCQECSGEGKTFETACSVCSGNGVENRRDAIEIDVPGGVEHGQTIRLTGQGEAAPMGRGAGDLYIVVRVKEHETLKRDGADIHSQLTISYSQATLGDKVDVDTIDGSGKLTIPGGTKSGTKFKLKGKGADRLHSSGRGDHYVEVIINVPKKLNRQQKKALKDLQELGL
jgi:molecular chaperone DnaJ